MNSNSSIISAPVAIDDWRTTGALAQAKAGLTVLCASGMATNASGCGHNRTGARTGALNPSRSLDWRKSGANA